MSASRTWNLRLNLDEFNALSASVYTDADRALLFQGITLGFNGGDCPDGVPPAFSRAFHLGSDARQEAEAFRVKMGVNGARGGRPSHRQDPGERDTDFETEKPTGLPTGLPEGNQQVYPKVNQTSTQSTIHNPLNEQPQPHERQTRSRASSPRSAPPSESEWIEYCVATWPNWSPDSAGNSFAYYQGVGWRTKAGPIKDWKAIARTAYGKAVEWGTLQPKSGASNLTRKFDPSYYEEK